MQTHQCTYMLKLPLPPPKQRLPTSKSFAPQAEQFPKNPSNPPTSRCDVYLFFNCKPHLGKSKEFNNQWMKIMVKRDFKRWHNSTTIHLLSVSISHNNMPTRTKSINEGLSQKVLMEMTWWFCSTSEVFTNFGSFIQKSYKYNLLFTLLHQTFKLYSNFEHFHQEIDKLKTIFENHGYPKSFVDFCIKKYLDKVFIKKKVVLKASKKELICVLPFLGKKSMQLRTRLVNTMQAEFVVLL